MQLIFDEGNLIQALKINCSGAIEAAANGIAEKARADLKPGRKVSVRMTENRRGRPIAMVVIQAPEGIAMQAKHGTLTRAAAQMGLRTRRTELRE